MATHRLSERGRPRGVGMAVSGARISVTCLSVASILVVASLLTRSPLWIGVASLVALAVSWTALRLMWTEVLEARRAIVSDRAATAAAYRDLLDARATEHAEVTTAMTERLAEAHLAQRELEGLVTQHESRAARAESRLAETISRLRALEGGLEDGLALPRTDDEVAALVAWDEQAGQIALETALKSAALQERKRA